MTVEELLNKVSAKELNEWRAIDLIDPIGGRRIDYNFAHLIFMLYTMLCGNKEKALLEEFMLDFENPFLTEEQHNKKQQRIEEYKQNNKQSKLDLNAIINRFKGMQKK